MEKWLECLTDKLEEYGYTVTVNAPDTIEIGKYTSGANPYDFSFTVNASSIEEFKSEVLKYYNGYDPDYEAFLWIKDGHGVNGAPYSAKEVIANMEECKKFIYEVYTVSNNDMVAALVSADSLLSEDNDDKFEALIEIFSEEFESDGEPWRKKGKSLLRAVAEDDIDGIFLALCGWSLKTLLAKAEEKYAEADYDE